MNEDEKFYNQVLEELRTQGTREGLWLKALRGGLGRRVESTEG